MKNVKIMLLSLMFALSGQTFAVNHDSVDLGIQQDEGIVYTYSEPEMFFTTPHELKLSVIWEILNCFHWDNGTPIDQCVNLEFLVVNETAAGDQLFARISKVNVSKAIVRPSFGCHWLLYYLQQSL